MAKIMVGLSGGVDSAVATYLLKKQGHEVIAGFMRNWDSMTNNDILGNPTNNDDICPQEKDYNDAKSVADALGVELYRIDFVKEYWDHVFSYFLDEYKKGRTPNPDILCNKYIKFDSFLNFALTKGVDYVATGHYAKVKHFPNGKSKLYKATDKNKDQSYFLCQLSQKQLSKALFPLEEIDKPEVRKIATELNLSISAKKDSTGICFIGERNFKEFLKNYLPAKRGNIVDIESKMVVGQHDGVIYYTIGQRKGLGIGGIKGVEPGSYFVVSKDVNENILYVAKGDDNEYLLADSCLVEDVNWIDDEVNMDGLDCQAKFRYRQEDKLVKLERVDDTHVMVYCKEPIKSITSGQAAVFYLGEECLGGGTICKVYRNGKLLMC
jgi:tRNA-specific 2-thiouridylase